LAFWVSSLGVFMSIDTNAKDMRGADDEIVFMSPWSPFFLLRFCVAVTIPVNNGSVKYVAHRSSVITHLLTQHLSTDINSARPTH